MNSDERKREILAWQQRLEDRFSHAGIVGGLYLSLLIELEHQCGRHFVVKYHGHRVLVDSFFEFFGQTLETAKDAVARNGWPNN